MEIGYRIIPGESIGPFRLGMARAEIENLNIRPMDIFQDGSGAAFVSVGIKVRFDESNRCKQIEACVFNLGKCAVMFTLAGRMVNNVSEQGAREIFLSISPDLRGFYGGFAIPQAGLKAVKWEHADDFIYTIVVEPPCRL